MFTGIIQTTAPIVWIVHQDKLSQYAIELTESYRTHLVVGASLAVHGICQTVRRQEGDRIFFDAIEETLRCTNLRYWKVGDRVNIERALRMGDEIGGHLLSGHIMGTGTIQKIEHPSDEQSTLTIQYPTAWRKYFFSKGFVALNGVSLTLGEISVDSEATTFTVHLIPETQRVTTLGRAQAGDCVNIEIDHQTQTIVESVERFQKS